MPPRFREGLKERIGPGARLRQHGDVAGGNTHVREMKGGFKGRDVPSIEGRHEGVEGRQGLRLFILGPRRSPGKQQAREQR